MWFLTFIIGILIGHYVIEDIKQWVIFHHARAEK